MADSGQSSPRADDSQRTFHEVLRQFLSDFPPVAVWYLATYPEFETLLLHVLLRYEQAKNDLLITAGRLNKVRPQLPNALTHGWEYLLRALCRACTPAWMMCINVELSEFYRVEAPSPRLMRINERRRRLAENEVYKFLLYVASRGIRGP